MSATAEERLARIEADIAAVKQIMAEQFGAFNLRLDEVVVSQMRSLGKRMALVEDHVRELREDRAREEGKKAGSRAVLAALLGVLSACAGAVGAFIGRLL